MLQVEDLIFQQLILLFKVSLQKKLIHIFIELEEQQEQEEVEHVLHYIPDIQNAFLRELNKKQK